MIRRMADGLCAAAVMLAGVGVTSIALAALDRLAANWTECRHWTGCPVTGRSAEWRP